MSELDRHQLVDIEAMIAQGTNPVIDPEMKAFILECAGDGMNADAVRDELHRLGFAWVKSANVAAVIEDNQST